MALAAGAVWLAAACVGPEGSPETDRIATVVADAISFPRQETAAGYAEAAAATSAGVDGRLTVIDVQELDADELDDPLGRLVFLVHIEGEQGAVFSTEPVTACYRAEFNHYGVIGEPDRVDCPTE
jgi:hypothetical protein